MVASVPRISSGMRLGVKRVNVRHATAHPQKYYGVRFRMRGGFRMSGCLHRPRPCGWQQRRPEAEGADAEHITSRKQRGTGQEVGIHWKATRPNVFP